YGTPLDATQLDATASVAGTFSYSPAAGTILDAGSGQTLTATFTPDDTTDYFTVVITTPINVKPVPLMVVPGDATILEGEALPAFKAQYAGFAPGEVPGVLSGALPLGAPSGAATHPGQSPITPGGIASANYQIIYNNGTLDVGSRPIPPVTVL